ncbi:Deoxyribonuclease-1 [Trichinella spiralis]|uniref:Deoxyribonuclease-1 n=1 Tax=Trichinella spiralis TaxID=6334 RepID=A0ABR3KF10_TRISP
MYRQLTRGITGVSRSAHVGLQFLRIVASASSFLSLLSSFFFNPRLRSSRLGVFSLPTCQLTDSLIIPAFEAPALLPAALLVLSSTLVLSFGSVLHGYI